MIVVRNGLDITEDFERYIADVERLRPLWDVVKDEAVLRVITGEQTQHFRTKAAIELAVAASEARLAERERCIKICEEVQAAYRKQFSSSQVMAYSHCAHGARMCAERISEG
jgi:hypothetical protein